MVSARETDDVESVARERVGSTLRDKWRLDALIGIGGMAAVYAGTHRNGLRGAVKVLHPELAAHRATRERFLREGYVANSIDHAGVVRVLDDDVDGGSVFLVMDLLEGSDLESIREAQPAGKLPPGAAVAIAIQLLDVLAAAHTATVIHRDLKPENAFVTHEGVVKVLDFGIARARFAARGHVTESGVSMGTPAFMPPEQAAGERDMIDARTDVWAVGATLFNLVTGTLVHDEPTLPRILAAAMTRPAPPVRLREPELNEKVAAVIDRALAFDPEDRFRTASEMREALLGASRDVDVWSAARLGALTTHDEVAASDQLSAFAATRRLGHAGKHGLWVAASGIGAALLVAAFTWRVLSTEGGGGATASSVAPAPAAPEASGELSADVDAPKPAPTASTSPSGPPSARASATASSSAVPTAEAPPVPAGPRVRPPPKKKSAYDHLY